jgi:putative transposase
MFRANRLSGQGGMFHVTHRCHNQEFLLKFALDRDGYQAKLREHLGDFQVSLLDYCITCNHVHLPLDTEEPLEISGLMRSVAAVFSLSGI